MSFVPISIGFDTNAFKTQLQSELSSDYGLTTDGTEVTFDKAVTNLGFVTNYGDVSF